METCRPRLNNTCIWRTREIRRGRSINWPLVSAGYLCGDGQIAWVDGRPNQDYVHQFQARICSGFMSHFARAFCLQLEITSSDVSVHFDCDLREVACRTSQNNSQFRRLKSCFCVGTGMGQRGPRVFGKLLVPWFLDSAWEVLPFLA